MTSHPTPSTTSRALAPTANASTLHERASLDGLAVAPMRFELWLLAGGERRRSRRPKNAQS